MFWYTSETLFWYHGVSDTHEILRKGRTTVKWDCGSSGNKKDTKWLNRRVRIQSFHWCILSFMLGTTKNIKLVQNWRASLGIRKSIFISLYFYFIYVMCNKIYVLYSLVKVTWSLRICFMSVNGLRKWVQKSVAKMNQKNIVTLSQYSKRTGYKHPQCF